VPTKSILKAANVPIIGAIMFLRCKVRRKDGKQHRYWSVVENTRTARGRVVQRHVLYLGEINDTQELAWRRSIEVLEEGATQPRTLSLLPEDRCAGVLADASIVHVKLSQLQLCRPRQWGACWLALLLWRERAYLARNRKFESSSLQRGVRCELDLIGIGGHLAVPPLPTTGHTGHVPGGSTRLSWDRDMEPGETE
jgi:hypothetical protein